MHFICSSYKEYVQNMFTIQNIFCEHIEHILCIQRTYEHILCIQRTLLTRERERKNWRELGRELGREGGKSAQNLYTNFPRFIPKTAPKLETKACTKKPVPKSLFPSKSLFPKVCPQKSAKSLPPKVCSPKACPQKPKPAQKPDPKSRSLPKNFPRRVSQNLRQTNFRQNLSKKKLSPSPPQKKTNC